MLPTAATAAVSTRVILFLFAVFTLGSNAYGLCGRSIVDNELFRFVYACYYIFIYAIGGVNFFSVIQLSYCVACAWSIYID